MEWLRKWKFWMLLLTASGLGAACFPMSGTGQSDERDPYFLEGEGREASKDFLGAAEAYHRAIENNPRNASAHKKLGFLFSQSLDKPDAAIYHFNKLLEYRKDDPHADVIREHVLRCRQRLAQTLSAGVLAKQTQDELLRLTDENARLLKTVAALNQQLHHWQRVAQATNAVPVTFPSGASNRTLDQGLSPLPVASSTIVTSAPPAKIAAGPGQREPSEAAVSPPPRLVKTPPPTMGTATNLATKPATGDRGRYVSYKIKSGDTFGSIARQRGTTARALILANPNVDPRRLKAGQLILVPQP
ncbi:MAG: LysM peptidoglycan-binding domain-containing protein [Verrucomicrobia bacterium]|nr:LysM peptidoglycan-binding domain-containing protein [Verrucomicrobiota bacterium]